MGTSAHYEKGSESRIAVVLSCPGKEEKRANRPAAGQTGSNLEEILLSLTDDYAISGFQRGKITVGNSWSKVEFDGAGGTGRRQATIPEILDAGNLERLAGELGEITDFIVCCGDNAREAVARLKADGRLREGCRILRVCHLSNLGINNSIKNDVNGKPIRSYKKSADKPSGERRSLNQIGKDNRKLRLEVVAKNLMEQILLRAPALRR